MAITGTFHADFNDFFAKVNQAQTTLGSLTGTSAEVAGAIDRMTATFSTARIVSEAGAADESLVRLGGRYGTISAEGTAALGALADSTKKVEEPTTLADRATSLLTGQVGKLTAAFSASSLIDRAVGTLVAWTQEAFSSAGATLDLAAKTGLSVEAIQQMGFVGQQTSVDLGAFTAAAYALSQRIAGGGDSVQGALGAMGLSLDALRGMRPEEQFDTVAGALGRVGDATTRNTLGTEAFGTKFAAIAPAIAQGYKDIAAAAETASEAQLKALNQRASAFDAMVENSKTRVKAFIADELRVSEILEQMTLEEQQHYQALVETGADAQGFVIGWANEREALAARLTASRKAQATEDTTINRNYQGELNDSILKVAALSEEQLAQITAAQQLGTTTEELTNRFGLSSAELKLLNERTADKAAKDKAAATEATALHNAMFSLDAIEKAEKWITKLGGVEQTTRMVKEKQKELNDVVMEAVRAYVALGEQVPEEMLKVANATRSGVDPFLDTTSGLIPVLKTFSDESSKTWDTYRTTVEDASAAIALATGASSRAQIDQILALGGTTRESLQATADKHRETYEFALAHSESFTAAQIENFRELAESGQAAADQWGQSFVENLQAVDAAAETTKGNIEAVAQTATNSQSQIAGVFNMPDVNPVTGAGMMGTDSRVTTRMMAGYTLDEAIALTQGTGSGIMGPRGTWTASGYQYGLQTDILAQDYFNARGGGTTVTVNVGGSVLAQSDLVGAIQQGMVESARATGTRLPARA